MTRLVRTLLGALLVAVSAFLLLVAYAASAIGGAAFALSTVLVALLLVLAAGTWCLLRDRTSPGARARLESD